MTINIQAIYNTNIFPADLVGDEMLNDFEDNVYDAFDNFDGPIIVGNGEKFTADTLIKYMNRFYNIFLSEIDKLMEDYYNELSDIVNSEAKQIIRANPISQYVNANDSGDLEIDLEYDEDDLLEENDGEIYSAEALTEKIKDEIEAFIPDEINDLAQSSYNQLLFDSREKFLINNIENCCEEIKDLDEELLNQLLTGIEEGDFRYSINKQFTKGYPELDDINYSEN